jgi:hypothetical protein
MQNTARGEDALAQCSPSARFEPVAFDISLQVVSAINDSLIELLVQHARDAALAFPLDASLRVQMAELSDVQRSAIAQCGVMLADVEFENEPFWRTLRQSNRSPVELNLPGAWLANEEALSHTLTALFGSLQVVRGTPGLAPFVLSMPQSVLTVFRTLGERALLDTARQHPHLFQPRWRQRTDIWLGILNFVMENDLTDLSRLNRHVLTIPGASAPQLPAYPRPRP